MEKNYILEWGDVAIGLGILVGWAFLPGLESIPPRLNGLVGTALMFAGVHARRKLVKRPFVEVPDSRPLKIFKILLAPISGVLALLALLIGLRQQVPVWLLVAVLVAYAVVLTTLMGVQLHSFAKRPREPGE